MVQFNEEKQKKQVKELWEKEAEDLAKVLSGKYGVGYADLTQMAIDTDALRLIPEKVARENNVAAFNRINKKIRVAVLSPNNDKSKKVITELEEKGYKVSIFMVSKKSLERAWERYQDISFSTETKSGVLEVSSEEIERAIKETKNLAQVIELIKKTLALKKSYRISRIVETILAAALAVDASDVHLEPTEDNVRLRLRLNGLLTDVLDFDRETYRLLLSRIKLLSGLKLNVKKEAQDGRFSIKIGDDDIEIRASSLPGAYEEAIVLRILNPKTIALPMEELGMEPELLEVIEREIRRPNGMVLNTGPTGSGKTTALYAFLRKVHKPDIKIITIEDPIEYHLPGIVQTQVDRKKKYTFEKGLKASLRQDPDIIMVGEIRDTETAKIAVNSALTGHLVFSTLHTNSAAGTFPRLLDLGVDAKILGPAINVVMAQRLVRKLCEKCKNEVPLEGEDRKLIEEVVNSIVKKREVSLEKMWVPGKCDECDETGYKGRIGVFEAILVDEEVGKFLNTSPSEKEIYEATKSQGILTIKQDGVLKLLKGVTTIEELKRVIDFE